MDTDGADDGGGGERGPGDEAAPQLVAPAPQTVPPFPLPSSAPATPAPAAAAPAGEWALQGGRKAGDTAVALKGRGDAAFKAKQYEAAFGLYTQAIRAVTTAAATTPAAAPRHCGDSAGEEDGDGDGMMGVEDKTHPAPASGSVADEAAAPHRDDHHSQSPPAQEHRLPAAMAEAEGDDHLGAGTRKLLAIVYSNRSGTSCYLGHGAEALEDARVVQKLEPDWVKGYSREAFAHLVLHDYGTAVTAYLRALYLEPDNSNIIQATGHALTRCAARKPRRSDADAAAAMDADERPDAGPGAGTTGDTQHYNQQQQQQQQPQPQPQPPDAKPSHEPASAEEADGAMATEQDGSAPPGPDAAAAAAAGAPAPRARAAERPWREVVDRLQCGICRDVFAFPVTLSCGTTVDRGCLQAAGSFPGCSVPGDWSANASLNIMAKLVVGRLWPERDVPHPASGTGCPELLATLPQSYRGHHAKSLALAESDLPGALASATDAVARSPRTPFLREHRGRLAFRAGQYLSSLGDALSAMRGAAAPTRPQIALATESICAYVQQQRGETGDMASTVERLSELCLSPDLDAPDPHEAGVQQLEATLEERIAELLPVRDEFDCKLCFNLLLEPVTTRCGHSFCRSCLARALDHNSTCPLCRGDLALSLREELHTDVTLETVLRAAFPREYSERHREMEQELEEQETRAVPIFVCSLAYPGIPCHLHVFEPRYRLMMRRVMQSGRRRFGMCLPSGDSFADYGTLLEISHFELLDDGRSIIQSVGLRKFRVLERGEKDGYATAEVEWVDDVPDPDEPGSRFLANSMEGLLRAARGLISTARGRLTAQQWSQINEVAGPEPENPAFTAYWLASFFELNHRECYELLRMRSPKQRLQFVIDLCQQPRCCIM